MNILLDSQDFDGEWAKPVLSAYITPETTITVIPFAFHETWVTDPSQWHECYNNHNGLYYHGIVKPFLQYGVEPHNIRFINYFKDSAIDLQKVLQSTDIIYFVGGFPEKTMARLIELGMKEIIEDYKGIIMGWSAGASMQAYQYFTSKDNHYKTYSDHQGLNFIKNFAVKVHYRGLPEQIEAINQYRLKTGNRVYCLSKESAIIYDKGTVLLLGNAFEFTKEIITFDRLVSNIDLNKLDPSTIDRILYEGLEYGGEDADCILVLGSSSAVKYRVPVAVDLFHKKKSQWLVMLGGRMLSVGSSMLSEADTMQQEAINLGVRSEDILIETMSLTTKENFLCALLVLERHFKLCNLKKIILVTTAYHMRRSLLMAKTYLPPWIQVIPCPADDTNTRRNNWHTNDKGIRRAHDEVMKIKSYIIEGTIPDFEI